MRFCYVRYCTLSEARDYWQKKQTGTHNKSENGRGVWLALCAHLTHLDTDADSIRN
jgi:hypothetical protein